MLDVSTIIIPDVHAGYAQSRVNDLAERLPDLLGTTPKPNLIFIGDVLDLWRATPEDALAKAGPLLEVMEGFLGNGGSIQYLLGNHDYHLLLDMAREKAIVQQMPEGIEYYHRYLMLTHQNKRILVCHGDDYDFLYLPLVKIDPLVPGHPLMPDTIYQFYEDVFEMDKQLISGYDKDGLRGLLITWIKERFFSFHLFSSEAEAFRGQFSLTGELTLAALQNTPIFNKELGLSPDFLAGGTSAPQFISNFSLQDWLASFHNTSDLNVVIQHTATAQAWDGIFCYNPFNSTSDVSAFSPFDYTIVGHFHEPRQTPDLPITDSGSWVEDPKGVLQSGTYVEIADGKIRLHFSDSGEVKEAVL